MPSASAALEGSLLDRLRRGDEEAFAELVSRYSSPLLRVATIYTGSRAVAEEVVQETWLGVIRGLDRFEGRSSLTTWIFRILTNIASSRAARGHWTFRPTRCKTPDDSLLSGELRVLRAVDQLPRAQRIVVTLRDIEGWPSEEVCAALEVSPETQRVLLHRARSRVRDALEAYMCSSRRARP